MATRSNFLVMFFSQHSGPTGGIHVPLGGNAHLRQSPHSCAELETAALYPVSFTAAISLLVSVWEGLNCTVAEPAGYRSPSFTTPAGAAAPPDGESHSPVRTSLPHTLPQLLACGRRNKILQPIESHLLQESRVAEERTLLRVLRLVPHHPRATDPGNRARPKTQLELSQSPTIFPSSDYSWAAYRCTMTRTFRYT